MDCFVATLLAMTGEWRHMDCVKAALLAMTGGWRHLKPEFNRVLLLPLSLQGMAQ